MTFDIENSLREIAERNKRGEKLPVLFTEQEIQAKMNEFISTAKSIISESPINLSRFQEINDLPSEIIQHYEYRCSNGEISFDDLAGKVSEISDSIREVIGWLLVKITKQSAIDKVDSFIRENPVGSNSFNELFKRLSRKAILLPEYAGREKIFYQTIIQLLQFEISSPKQTIKSISNIGFNSTLSHVQINTLWEKLTTAKPPYIDAQHGVKNFAAVFSGGTLPSDFKPVAWIDTAPKDKNTKNTQTLFELVNCLIPELTQPENASSLYNFIIERFKDNQENEFKRANLKQAYAAWGKKSGASKPPRNKAIIDIFKGLK